MPEDLQKLLNLNVLNVTENAGYEGIDDFPRVGFDLKGNVDYIALFNNRNDYHKTSNTCLGFYNYDSVIDGKNGIYWSIYFGDKRQMKKYKTMFKGIRYAIEPDYSQCGDIPIEENRYRCFRARVVNVWLTMECNILVFPNISYVNKRSSEYIFEGIMPYSTVAFSLKGMMKNKEDAALIKEGIKETVDKIHPRKIIIYTTSGNKRKINELFKYAIVNNIKLIVPDNRLLLLNKKSDRIS